MSRTNTALIAWTISAALGMAILPLSAQHLDVPVMEYPDEDLDTCSLGQVAGLKIGGDGFLAVRSGPGTQFPKLDELYNGDEVWMFDFRGDWIGIVYDAPNLSCSAVGAPRPVPYRGGKGWVHRNWIVQIAG